MTLFFRFFLCLLLNLSLSPIFSQEYDTYYDDAGYADGYEGDAAYADGYAYDGADYADGAGYEGDAGYADGGAAGYEGDAAYADDYAYDGAGYEGEAGYADDGAGYEGDVVNNEDNNAQEPPTAETPPPTPEDTQQPTVVTTQTLVIPLLQTYKPIFTVDPQNPRLPPNHALVRLRGTMWRGTQRLLVTNKRGVVQEQRQYIFFAEDRDAVGFKYASYYSKNLPSEPSTYMSLIPLLQTNTYTPLDSPSLKKYDALSTKDTNVVFEINNDIPIATPAPAAEPQIVAPADPPLAITPAPQPEATEPVLDEIVDTPTDTPADTYYDEEYDNVYDANYEGALDDDYPIDGDYEGYGDYYSLHEFPELINVVQEFVAQNLSTSPSEYIVNLGGNNSGIFVYKTRNPDQPYKVIFLSLEQGITLYALTIDNSFNVSTLNTEAGQQARELYINILTNKINMGKFQRVLRPFETN